MVEIILDIPSIYSADNSQILHYTRN